MALPAPPIVERVCAAEAPPERTVALAIVIGVPLSVAVGVSETELMEFTTATYMMWYSRKMQDSASRTKWKAWTVSHRSCLAQSG